MTVSELISELEKYPKDMLVGSSDCVIESVRPAKLYMDHRGDLSCFKCDFDNLESVELVVLS